jgi:hypothetical protein
VSVCEAMMTNWNRRREVRERGGEEKGETETEREKQRERERETGRAREKDQLRPEANQRYLSQQIRCLLLHEFC